jgi:hypothetical protein
MSSIIASIKDVFASVLELIWSFFTTAGDLIQATASFVVRSFEELVSLVLNFFKGLVHLTGDLGSFVAGKSHILQPCAVNVGTFAWLRFAAFYRQYTKRELGNIVILAVLGLAVFGFLTYQRNQGNQVKVGNKKLN